MSLFSFVDVLFVVAVMGAGGGRGGRVTDLHRCQCPSVHSICARLEVPSEDK